MYKKLAKKVSYGARRSKKDIKYIVIHYTANKGDTAKNNVDYFANGNTRQAGAHFFVDRQGNVGRSIPMNRVAYAVGGFYDNHGGSAKYYQKCTNSNSVSIELCDLHGQASWEQMLATRELIAYIKKYCPNADTIIRHWDVNGKDCPAPMIGVGNKNWKHFYNKMTKNYLFRAEVTETAAIRSSRGVKPDNKIGVAESGDIVLISKVVGKWGRLLKKKDGKFQWITLTKVKEI